MSNGNTSMYTSWCSLGKSHSVHSFSLPWKATTWTGFGFIFLAYPFIIALDSFISAFPGHINQSLHLSLDSLLLLTSISQIIRLWNSLPPLDLDSSYLSLKCN